MNMQITTYSPKYLFLLIRSKLPKSKIVKIIVYFFLVCLGFYLLPLIIGWYLIILCLRKLPAKVGYSIAGIILLVTLLFSYVWGYSFVYAYQHPTPDTTTPSVTITHTPTPTPTKKVVVSMTTKPTHTPTSTPTKTPTSTPTKVITPIQTTVVSTPVPTQSLHISITQSAGSVGQGNTATEGITTGAGAYCTIEVDYESGPSKAQGLTPQTADGNGNIVWSWMVGTRTTPGSWPIYINCSLNGVSAQASDQVNVTNQ